MHVIHQQIVRIPQEMCTHTDQSRKGRRKLGWRSTLASRALITQPPCSGSYRPTWSGPGHYRDMLVTLTGYAVAAVMAQEFRQKHTC